MLQRFSGFLITLIVAFMLISCATVDESLHDPILDQETSVPDSFAAWHTLNNTQADSLVAQDLLHQADVLIEQHEMEKASDKLERLLSIEPRSAQAWSRLSWIALQANNMSKTQQMAQRSNSHASSNNQLKILNWSFIREAAHRSGDVVMIKKAEKMIETLNSSKDLL